MAASCEVQHDWISGWWVSLSTACNSSLFQFNGVFLAVPSRSNWADPMRSWICSEQPISLWISALCPLPFNVCECSLNVPLSAAQASWKGCSENVAAHSCLSNEEPPLWLLPPISWHNSQGLDVCSGLSQRAVWPAHKRTQPFQCVCLNSCVYVSVCLLIDLLVQLQGVDVNVEKLLKPVGHIVLKYSSSPGVFGARCDSWDLGAFDQLLDPCLPCGRSDFCDLVSNRL